MQRVLGDLHAHALLSSDLTHTISLDVRVM